MSEKPSVTPQHDPVDGPTEVVADLAAEPTTDPTAQTDPVADGDRWVDDTAREAAPPDPAT